MTTETIKECSCDSEKETKPIETTKEAEVPKAVVPTAEAPKEDQEIPKWAATFNTKFDKLQTDYTNISGQLSKLTALETQIGVRPVTQVSNEKDEPFSLVKSIEKVKRWVESDRTTDCAITIPVDVLRGINTKQVKTPNGLMEAYRNPYEQDLKIREALGYTGTQAGQDMDTDVALEAGGISYVPVTQFAKYKDVKQGDDRARFFKADFPATGSQTPGTVATVGTMDIEAIEVTPSTITGVFLEVDTDDIENNPYDTMGVVVKHSAIRFDDFIATDMLDTVSAEGTLTPGKWIKGSDGSVITNSDTASVALDPTGIATGVEYLDDQGYTRAGQQPVCFLDPQQFKELIEDTELTNYIAFAEPNAYRQNQMAELYGCKLVKTNAVQHRSAQTNPSINAIMCVPNHSYGVASKRSVNIKFHEVPEENQIWATTNWRIKSGVIDASSIVRISTTD